MDLVLLLKICTPVVSHYSLHSKLILKKRCRLSLTIKLCSKPSLLPLNNWIYNAAIYLSERTLLPKTYYFYQIIEALGMGTQCRKPNVALYCQNVSVLLNSSPTLPELQNKWNLSFIILVNRSLFILKYE